MAVEELVDIEKQMQNKEEGEKEQKEQNKPKKQKYRKDKPWDNDTIDHWKIDAFTQDDNPNSFLEESSFATLFPQYREQYLKQIWPDVKASLQESGVKAELDLVEGSMTVKTTKKTFDPFIIIKARDLIKLLARSVPFHQAKKILEDDMQQDIMKIKSFVRSKEKFVKRRQRLIGPNGSTLKALELLTGCYIHVQGQTCCMMGTIKGIKQARRVIEDCFHNVHPVYHIKELMIRKELEKDENLKEENWERFLPKFKKRNVQTKKLKKQRTKKKRELFPEQQLPRKEDIAMETGEYFLNEEQKNRKRRTEREAKQQETTAARKEKRKDIFVPKEEHMESSAKRRKISSEDNNTINTKDMANKLKDKSIKSKNKKSDISSALL